ncbi:hypothetical protein BH11PSE11_BH11PSE11_22850 [soil metagenome]
MIETCTEVADKAAIEKAVLSAKKAETAKPLPPGLVMWPASAAASNRLCVLISDIHCTDCTVGNQTASETDWQIFFDQLLFACGHPTGKTPELGNEQHVDEVLLVLNGDIVDVIRSSKWTEAGVYPWHRDNPRFDEIVLEIMRDIVAIHADIRPAVPGKPYSGFFYWMRQTIAELRGHGVPVTIIPIVGNHDKELQVVPAARKMFYEACLGITAESIPQRYRDWVAAQLGTPVTEEYPCMPFYLADHGLRLLATHGQWRDGDNARPGKRWKLSQGWRPDLWHKEKYKPFSDPCFGDTVASAMLSRFIWSASKSIVSDTRGAIRIHRLLDEMDLYRPTVSAVVRLLSESRRLASEDPAEKGLHGLVLDCFRESLRKWLAHKETWLSASGGMKFGLAVIYCFCRFRSYWIDVTLMRLMAKVQEPEASIDKSALLKLPTFVAPYRNIGLRLHVEGHTHVALEEEVQFLTPEKHHANYTYVNLGAWRDRVIPKRNTGYRRLGVGRAMFIFDLAKLAVTVPNDAFRYYVRDMTSWGDRRDHG